MRVKMIYSWYNDIYLFNSLFYIINYWSKIIGIFYWFVNIIFNKFVYFIECKVGFILLICINDICFKYLMEGK